MSDLKILLQEKLKETRPNLSTSSVKTYISILSNMYKKNLNGEGNIEWFNKESNQILKSLEEKNDQTKKTNLSASYFSFISFIEIQLSFCFSFIF